MKYIEAVVKGWAEEGLLDVIAVEKYLAEYDKKQYLYKRIFQALGFSRNATEEEKKIMDNWFESLGFTIEKVLSACSRTTGISNPNINYVNKVLLNWYEEEKSGKKSGSKDKDSDKKELTAGDIMKYYEALRLQEEEEAEQRRREVFESVPRIKEIEDEINSQGAVISKIIISDRVDRKSAMEELKKRMDALNTEKAFLLTDNGFELNHMEVQYQCTRCKDTGMLETGERCQCFGEITKEKIRQTLK
jgi:DnaD/phage-associated family protein